jgi:hypothetical protein
MLYCPTKDFLVLISVKDFVDQSPIVRLEGSGKLKEFNDIGDRARDLPTCSIAQARLSVQFVTTFPVYALCTYSRATDRHIP